MALLGDIVRVLQEAQVSYTVRSWDNPCPGDPDLVITVAEESVGAHTCGPQQDECAAGRGAGLSPERRATDRLVASTLPLSSVLQVGAGVIHVWLYPPRFPGPLP